MSDETPEVEVEAPAPKPKRQKARPTRTELIQAVDPNFKEGDPVSPYLAITDKDGHVVRYLLPDASPGIADVG